jgi:ATP-binding cassette, subfamily C, bacterial CydC
MITARVLRLSRSGAGPLALSVLSGAGAALCGIGLMAASAWLISRAAQHPPVLHLTVAIVAVRAFGIGRAALRYVERLTGHDAAFRVLGSIRVLAYRGLERIAPAGLRGLRSGDLVSRFVTDMDAAMDLLTRVVLPYLVAAVAGAATVAFLTAVLPAAGVILLLGLVAVATVVPALQAAATRRADRRTAPLRGALTAQVVELLHGAPDLILAGATASRLTAIERTDAELRRTEARSATALGLGTAVTGLLAGIVTWLALVAGTAAVRASTLDGVLLAVVVLTPLAAFDVVTPLPGAVLQLRASRGALGRAFAVIDAPAQTTEPDRPRAAPTGPYHLRLDAVTARWGPDGPDAVRELTLDLPPGRRVALVGPTGCGKSTVAALLVRFLDPVRGSVTINGHDLRTLSTEDIRRVVTLIAEDAHVFDTTVEENLRLARPDATPEQLRAALHAVGLLDALPAGLATRVGERGARLSGGQCRRLVVARALLTDAPVLILDEPTEHLDDDGAEATIADLLRAAEGRTVLLITHRPHGLDAMDEVVPLAPPGRGPSALTVASTSVHSGVES